MHTVMSFFTKRSALRSSSAGSAPGPARACIGEASVLPDQQVVFSYLTTVDGNNPAPAGGTNIFFTEIKSFFHRQYQPYHQPSSFI